MRKWSQKGDMEPSNIKYSIFPIHWAICYDREDYSYQPGDGKRIREGGGGLSAAFNWIVLRIMIQARRPQVEDSDPKTGIDWSVVVTIVCLPV